VIVVDASIAVDFLLDLAPHSSTIASTFAAEPDIAAPHLLDVEVTQVLRRWLLAGKISEPRARAALEDLADLPLLRYEHVPLLARAFDFHANATAYDAVYLALAEALRAPLLTRDSALAKIPGCRVRTIVLP
jgi:predicted nucleic acid-binding protein